MKVVQTLIDFIAVAIAAQVAIWLRFHSGIIPLVNDTLPPSGLYINGTIIASLIVVILLYAMRTYDTHRVTHILGACLIATVILLLLAFLIRTEPPLSRLVLILFALIFPAILLTERTLFFRMRRTNGIDMTQDRQPET